MVENKGFTLNFTLATYCFLLFLVPLGTVIIYLRRNKSAAEMISLQIVNVHQICATRMADVKPFFCPFL